MIALIAASAASVAAAPSTGLASCALADGGSWSGAPCLVPPVQKKGKHRVESRILVHGRAHRRHRLFGRRRRCGCAINPRIRTITNALSRQDFSCPARLPRLGHGPYPPKRRRRPLSPPLIADVDLNLHTRHATTNAFRLSANPSTPRRRRRPEPHATCLRIRRAVRDWRSSLLRRRR